jgi:hypothetical protein
MTVPAKRAVGQQSKTLRAAHVVNVTNANESPAEDFLGDR